MKIAILGYGVEGRSVHRYFENLDLKCEIDIFDQSSAGSNDTNVKVVEDFLDIDFTPYDIITRSPSIPPDSIRNKIIKDKDGGSFEFTSSTQIFFDKCKAPIIGITGTKGKGTASSLIACILRAAGKKVHLVGNIGLPALDDLPKVEPDDIVVFELSSFQLWDLERKSPHVAVVLHMEPDHLDVHVGLEDYVSAKANITRRQLPDDTVVFNDGNKDSVWIADQSKASNRLPYPSSEFAHIKDGYFYFGEKKLCSVNVLKLLGEHNQQNALAAINATSQYTLDPVVIEQGLGAFDGLPHRLKFVAEKQGVRYYDDSISTTSGSTIAALRSFDQPKVIILGGSSKGVDYTELAKVMKDVEIRKAVLVGQEAEQIQCALSKEGFDNYISLGSDTTMELIVAEAAKATKPGDIVLLSPAAASFGMFKNYVDRGKQFVEAVEAL